jgi:hypothetical protein
LPFYKAVDGKKNELTTKGTRARREERRRDEAGLLLFLRGLRVLRGSRKVGLTRKEKS